MSERMNLGPSLDARLAIKLADSHGTVTLLFDVVDLPEHEARLVAGLLCTVATYLEGEAKADA